MNDILRGLEPEAVFRNFESLTRIPRGSGNEKGVSDFLFSFAKQHRLEVVQDPSLNVIIRKNATPGYEKSKRVILQGHMDMVAVKEDDIDFDFEKDPIPILIDGDMIRTKGTTLGADDGIALAMTMAILESKTIEHPPLTALFTISEETGMDGVINLKPGTVSGDVLINIDSEEEGIFLASCAGGINVDMTLPVSFIDPFEDNEFYEIIVKGLIGGHSGSEINKNRASAIVLLGRLLQILDEQAGIEISYVNGGIKMNAVPKSAKAVISVQKGNIDKLKEAIKNTQDIFRNEYSSSDSNIVIDIKCDKENQKILSRESKKKLIGILRVLPFGVQAMSADIDDLVETSSNIGMLETKADSILISSSVRSSVKSRKEEICKRIQAVGEITGSTVELNSDYHDWQFKKNSPIRDLMVKTYKDMFGKDAKVAAIHAGLECGYLIEKVGDIDMISLGPNMYDVHTPDEHLSISSTKRIFEFLCQVLKRMK